MTEPATKPTKKGGKSASSTTTASEENLIDDRYRLYATIAFIVTILCIGVPMWWKTTAVHRVVLPTSDIEHLSKAPVIALVNVYIHTLSESQAMRLSQELGTLFNDSPIIDVNFIPITIDPADTSKAHSPAALEQLILRKLRLNPGDFIFIEWHKLTDEVIVNSDRSAFISTTARAEKLAQVLRLLILQETTLRSVLGTTTTVEGKTVRHKSAPPQPHYNILISVVNPNPELQTLNWNMRVAAQRYIKPFLDQFEVLSRFTIKSQWKYQVKFTRQDKQVLDETKLGRHYALSEDELSQIITSLEKTLGGHVSSDPSINLVFYAPPCKSAPLHIYDRQGNRLTNQGVDAFVSGKWGGVVILNPPIQTCLDYMENENHTSINVDNHDAMEIALYLLRKIFNLEMEFALPSVNVTQCETVLPRAWEVDSYLRVSAVHLIQTARNTLISLVQLLNSISYIVINDNVGVEINRSLKHINEAKDALAEGRLYDAVTLAKQGYISAEAAFFDPSLLALLYFPDEQKYAIYIPLFLPIMIPVLLSILSIKKFFSPKKSSDPTST